MTFFQRIKNLGKLFLKLLYCHFPRAHKLHKIFNGIPIKISHCCIKNTSSVIFSHNTEVLQPRNKNYGWNCRKKEFCLLGNKGLKPNIIYESQITSNTNNEHKKYLSAAKNSLKERYSNHLQDFKHKKCLKCTKLSKDIWSLKNRGIAPIIKRRIVKKVNSKVSRNYCNLCLTEKFFIIKSLSDNNLLNKRSELVSKCRHKNKLLLCHAKRNGNVDWCF